MISWPPKNRKDKVGVTLQPKSISLTLQVSHDLPGFHSGQIPSAIVQWT